MKKVNTKLTYTYKNTLVIEIVIKSIVGGGGGGGGNFTGFFYVFYC